MLEEYNSTNAKSLRTYFGFAPQCILKGKGGYVFDQNNDAFLDLGMALGSVSIGYACTEIDNKVTSEIKNGVNFSRPSYLESLLTRTILKDVTFSKDYVVRYSKSSSLLMNVIPRICRYITKKELVAYPIGAYLGNADWYLSKCSNSSGILEGVRNSTITFSPGNINELRQLFFDYGDNLACIIMEPYRNVIFEKAYYQELRSLCDSHGVMLVFDETISGYRYHYPLAQCKINCASDLTVIGKAIANGYSLAAVLIDRKIADKIDLREVYEFSTTHAGEVVGLSAAISTLQFYKSHFVVDDINQKGKFLLKLMNDIVSTHKLQRYIQFTGRPTYFRVCFCDSHLNEAFCKFLFERSVLCRGVISVCYSHSYDDLARFTDLFDSFCKKILVEI